MRGAKLLLHVRQAMSNLNPSEVRAAAETPVSVVLHATDEETYSAMERALVPDAVTPQKRNQAMQTIRRADTSATPGPATIQIYDSRMAYPEGAFLFDAANPQKLIDDVLAAHPDLHLALARRIPAFRECVAADVIKNVSRENATFALATSIPSIVPLLSLPFAIGEFASDTAFLTVNQVRMAFLLAAASGREVGYGAQKSEIASIIASAFGWRALARELVGKIPMGGGLIPKAAIAFAGTFVVGASIERLYRTGYGYSPTEKEAAYRKAFERGKQIASAMLSVYRQRTATRLQ